MNAKREVNTGRRSHSVLVNIAVARQQLVFDRYRSSVNYLQHSVEKHTENTTQLHPHVHKLNHNHLQHLGWGLNTFSVYLRLNCHRSVPVVINFWLIPGWLRIFTDGWLNRFKTLQLARLMVYVFTHIDMSTHTFPLAASWHGAHLSPSCLCVYASVCSFLWTTLSMHNLISAPISYTALSAHVPRHITSHI